MVNTVDTVKPDSDRSWAWPDDVEDDKLAADVRAAIDDTKLDVNGPEASSSFEAAESSV